MKYDLKVYRHREINESSDILMKQYKDVDITFSDQTCKAIAKKESVEVIRMETFDDCPVTIEEDVITIEGIIGGDYPNSNYGLWKLTQTG